MFGVHILPLTMLSLTCIASKGVPSDALIVALDVALAYNAVVVVAVVLALWTACIVVAQAHIVVWICLLYTALSCS